VSNCSLINFLPIRSCAKPVLSTSSWTQILSTRNGPSVRASSGLSGCDVPTKHVSSQARSPEHAACPTARVRREKEKKKRKKKEAVDRLHVSVDLTQHVQRLIHLGFEPCKPVKNTLKSCPFEVSNATLNLSTST